MTAPDSTSGTTGHGDDRHGHFVSTATGGMVTDPRPEPFAGSERLRPDGRPRPEFRAELRRINNPANALTVIVALALPCALVALVAAAGTWWAVLAAIVPMACLQNRIVILHHEAAHRLLFSWRPLNDLIGITLCGWLVFGTGTHAYRRSHANHHRDEFGPKEPDLILYAFYPISADSLRRKLGRDLSGVSAYRRHRGDLSDLLRSGRRVRSLRFLGGQAAVFALFALAGVPWLYLFSWLVPYATVFQVLNRLRAIAEHGGMTRSPDRRLTTHQVRQSRLARAVFVPIGVGHHLAHHVDSGVPFRNLARFQAALEEDGYLTPEQIWPSYRALWRALATG